MRPTTCHPAAPNRTGRPRPHPAARAAAWAAAALITAWCAADEKATWPTARGNPQRTGNLDGMAGPRIPKVVWAYKAQEHFVASPVVGDKRIYASGLGAFNTPQFHCLSIDPKAEQRLLWTKTAPYVTRPTVCSPAIVDGLLVFGDGMHQTDGAVLYCVQADSGRPVWQYPVPGKLVHLEGAPTVVGDLVFIGGGDAGILCVALKQVTLEGKKHSFAEVDALLEKRWTELVAKYEEEKKKDPEFAVPPSEEALPKAVPNLVWQQGKGIWHVDAPVATSGSYVVAGSAYLDHEKIGRRSLLCLRTRDGSLKWEVPLKINPWAGPTVVGDLVLVACSSIRFDPKLIGSAKGEVVAVGLRDGQVRWRKDVPGGVLSPVCVRGSTAYFTATDGKVRAWDVGSGREIWTYDAAHAFFAGVAVAGNRLYAADLKGVVHALDAGKGTKQWAHSLATDPVVQSPCMIYASPVVHQGNVYVATCNLEGPHADQPCAVVCIGEGAGGENDPLAKIEVDAAKRTVRIPCFVAKRKLPTLSEIYPVEVVATFPSPRGQKAHEAVVVFEARPSEIHKALEAFGLKPGRPAQQDAPPRGPEVAISLELTSLTGKPRLLPIEKTIIDRRTGKPLPLLTWRFTGSVMKQPDPDKDETFYGADLTGTLITIFPVTEETVFQAELTMEDGRLVVLETNRSLLPREGTRMSLVIRAK